MNKNKINYYIKELENLLLDINTIINTEPVQLSATVENNDFEHLKNLLQSDTWPAAARLELIADPNNIEDQLYRASGINNILLGDVQGLKVLDYGTGNGFLVNELSKNNTSFGFDIVNQWEPYNHNGTLTTDWNVINTNAPYDLVILYDVLDHIVEETPVTVLEKIKNILSPTGKVIIRNHPWCSRTGGHLYYDINKAYVHLVFTDEELKSLGYTLTPTIKIIHPLGDYRSWFNNAGFVIKNEFINRESVEKFFTDNELIKNRIKQHWKFSPDNTLKSGDKFPTFQLEQQFIDYTITL